MSEYDELRERVARLIAGDGIEDWAARPDNTNFYGYPTTLETIGRNVYLNKSITILAEVFRTLKRVTPEIAAEFERSSRMGAIWTAESVIREFLRASPLAPPKSKP